MADEDSTSTSCDDKSDFNENPTRDALADGLMSFMRPRIENLGKMVETVKTTQDELKAELDGVSTSLDNIFKNDNGIAEHFQKYAEKIANMKHQLTVIDNVLQSARNRVETFTSKMNALQKRINQQCVESTNEN